MALPCIQSCIHIIGLGVAENAELSNAAEQALCKSKVVIGSARQLETITPFLCNLDTDPLLIELPKLSALDPLIKSHAGKNVSVLASGDPLFYGIGRWFSKNYPSERLCYHPAISSIQAACHALGLSLQDVEVLSLHGRPLEKIRTKLQRQKTLVILTDKNSSPQVLAEECVAAGFEQSTLCVCEKLGYETQQVREFKVAELVADTSSYEFDPLHITVIKTSGGGGVLPEFPGIPDGRYITEGEPGKGMITKREVRLAIVSLMQPGNDDVIWDVGAGCGGVAVELAYWNERVQVHAVEHNASRLACLEANRDRFGVVSNLHIVEGRAPQVLKALPPANKVFIGGSDGELENLLKKVWQQLPNNGVLVASAVTENTKQHLIAFAEFLYDEQEDSQKCNQKDKRKIAEVETLQVAINKGSMLAGQLMYRPNLPVTLFKYVKLYDSVDIGSDIHLDVHSDKGNAQ